MQNKELDNYSFIMGYMEGIATAIHIQTSMNCETNISELDEGTIKNLTEAWYKDLKNPEKAIFTKAVYTVANKVMENSPIFGKQNNEKTDQ